MLLSLFVQVGERALQSAGTSALRESDGVVPVDIEGIQVILASFYVSLSTKNGTDQVAQAYLLSCVSDRVPAYQVDDCKGLLSAEECLLLCLAWPEARHLVLMVSRWSFTFGFGTCWAEDLVTTLLSWVNHRGVASSPSPSRRVTYMTRSIGDPLPCSMPTTKLPPMRSPAVYLKLFISLWPIIRLVGCREGL